MSERKFYKTVVPVEILSEEPIGEVSLADLETIRLEVTSGSWSGRILPLQQTVLDGKQAADALAEQASDPSFFMLTAEGEDIRD